MRFRLLIFLTLSLVTILPVIVLAMWVVSDAQNKENEVIADKHLVIAKYLSKALDRYSFDLKNGFELIAKMQRTNKPSPPISTFMKSLNFIHFCITDLKSGVVVNAIAPKNLPCPKKVPPKHFHAFVNLLEEGRVAFSPLMMNPRGIPTLYLLRAYDDKLVIGAVATDYIVQQGNSVSFGIKGHSAIVDQTGQVISHPLLAWRKSKKDIGKIPPVQRMMARKTGTMKFYSPALKADMVTGYSFVPTTGWGVMVPQPIAELRATAVKIQKSAIGIVAIGISVSALLSWFISGYLTSSLSSIVRPSQRMAKGDLNARVEMGTGFIPKELEELGLAFNSMASAINIRDLERNIAEMKLVSSETRFRSAIDAIDEGVWDWNLQTGEVVFSDKWPRIFGYELEEIEPNIQTWKNMLHPDDEPRVMQTVSKHLDGTVESYESTHRMKHKNGKWLWILDRGNVVERDEEGNPIRMIGADLDITRRREWEEELNESRERFRSFAEAAADRFWETDEDFRFTYLSDSSEIPYRPQTSEVIGKYRWEVSGINEHDENWVQLKKDVKAQKPIREFEYLRIRPDGQDEWIRMNANPYFDNEGKFKGYRGTNVEITEFKKRLDIQNQFFLTMDKLDAAYCLWDEDDRLVSCNDQFRESHSDVDLILEAGVTFEDFISALGEKRWNLSSENAISIEDWISKRKAEHLKPNSKRLARFGSSGSML